jgi:hypothetical protein
MRLSGIRAAVLLALAATGLSGCHSSYYNYGTLPSVDTSTDFSGTIAAGSAGVYQVFVAQAGIIDVKLTELKPDGTLKLTMSVGAYDQYYGSCDNQTNTRTVGVDSSPLTGLATATTTLCVSLADPNKVIPTGATETYTIKVTRTPQG